MHSTVPAQIGKVVFIHLEPGEDVLLSMIEVIEREQLQSGLILTVTGAVSEGRLSLPRRVEGVHESPG
jgi:predicted DNA-binding protein with PD1-like motif